MKGNIISSYQLHTIIQDNNGLAHLLEQFVSHLIFRIPQHHSIIRLKNSQGNHIEAAEKLLADNSQLTSAATSTDSSRISSASHSRNSSTGIPPNQRNTNVSTSISDIGGRQQDSTMMTTVLSSFLPASKPSDNTVPAVASSQALLDPETKLPNV